jgi:hypothetical protein
MANATYADLLGDDILLHYDASDASSIFEDTAGSDAAEDGDTVRCWKPQSTASMTGFVTEATNGPTYRANYASSGYPAIEFDGTDDRLVLNTPGLVPFTRLFFLYAAERSTAFAVMRVLSIGTSASHYIAAGTASSINNRLQSVGGTALTLDFPFADRKAVAACVIGDGQNQIDQLANGTGNKLTSVISASLGDRFVVGMRPDGAQFWQGPIFEIMVIAGTCEWGQVIRAAKIMRDKWGIDDPNAYPQKITGTGTAGFTGIRGVSRRLGT